MTRISIKALLLCQLADDVDRLDEDVRQQLSKVLKEQDKLRDLIEQRDTLQKAHDLLCRPALFD